MVWVVLLLQAGPANDVLLERGLLGALAAGLLAAVLWFFRRMVKELDEVKDQRDTMLTTNREMVPLLDRCASVIERSTLVHEQRQAADDRMRDALGGVLAELREIRTVLGMRPRAPGG